MDGEVGGEVDGQVDDEVGGQADGSFGTDLPAPDRARLAAQWRPSAQGFDVDTVGGGWTGGGDDTPSRLDLVRAAMRRSQDERSDGDGPVPDVAHEEIERLAGRADAILRAPDDGDALVEHTEPYPAPEDAHASAAPPPNPSRSPRRLRRRATRAGAPLRRASTMSSWAT